MNREALAWAAGLYDGEGGLYFNPSGRGLCLQVAQGHPGILNRFQAAVGLGKVYGPYGVNQNMWYFRARKFETVQAIFAMLWTFLSQPKQDQIRHALHLYENTRKATP